jgi:ribosomal protein S18 acetylase RimI-like enzyme
MGATNVRFRFFLLMLLALLVLQLLPTTQALTIQPVQTAQDIAALAELRYNEWMQSLPSDQQPPSRAAFGAATAEIIQERTGSATPFLARTDSRQAVGAAELSSVELEGVVDRSEDSGTSLGILYVTDVVTSQAHRRQGIAQALMVALEEEAGRRGTQCLLLHVKPSNHVALAFYQSTLGYREPTDTLLAQWDLNLDRLTENTATQGQILLCKELPPSSSNTSATTTRKKKTLSGAGFGGGGGIKPKKRAK